MSGSIALSTTSPDPGATFIVTGAGFTAGALMRLYCTGQSPASGVIGHNVAGAFGAVGLKAPAAPGSPSVFVEEEDSPGSGTFTVIASATTQINVGGVVVTPPPTPATAPDPPTSLTGVAGDTVADLSWSAPVQDGGSAITGYQPYKDGSTLGSPVSTLTKHVTGLTNTTSYAFKVKSINAIGSSADSNVVNLTPAAAAVSDWSGKPAYLSYSSSAPISMNGQSGFTISAKKFVSQVGANVISVHLTNCSNFTITDLDFDGCTEPFEFENCTDFRISFCRSRNIVGPYQRDGTHRGNFYQFGSCYRYEIDHNKILGGNTEDVMSNFKSGGSDASHTSKIHDNQIDLLHNTQWTSPSGTGIILGDAQVGGYVEVYRNTLLSPGQVGIAIVGGQGHKIHDNTLYAAPRPGLVSPNVGMASNYSTAITAEVYKNTVYWRQNSGSQNSHWWGSGTINDHDNSWAATSLDPATLAVTL